MADERRRRVAMEKREPGRDAVADMKLGTSRRKQPSRKTGETFSVTFALTEIEDNLVEELTKKTGSRSRSNEVRLAIHERAERILNGTNPG